MWETFAEPYFRARVWERSLRLPASDLLSVQERYGGVLERNGSPSVRLVRIRTEDVARENAGTYGTTDEEEVMPRSLVAKTEDHVFLLEWALRRSIYA